MLFFFNFSALLRETAFVELKKVCNFIKVFKNENGSAMPLVLVAAVLVGGVSATQFSLMERMKEAEKLANVIVNIKMASEAMSLKAKLKSNFSETVENNSVMSCINPALPDASCIDQEKYEVMLYQSDGTVLINPDLQGFDLGGHICLRQDDPNCLIGFRAYVTFRCEGGQTSCLDPESMVFEGVFDFHQLEGQGLPVHFNPENYQFRFDVVYSDLSL